MIKFDNHESESKKRYEEMQGRLTKYVEAGDEAGLRLLAAQLDAQLKLEDFLIRFREADHAKIRVWGTIFVSGVISLIVTLLTLLAHVLYR